MRFFSLNKDIDQNDSSKRKTKNDFLKSVWLISLVRGKIVV